MFKRICLILFCSGIAGCASFSERVKNYANNFEAAPAGRELTVKLPFRESFSRTLKILEDSGMKLLEKDIEKGMIFFEDDMEAVTYGLAFQPLAEQRTQIILKAFKNRSWATYNILDKIRIMLELW